MSKTVISCEGLTKYYGKSRGIEDLTFEVRPGQVYGFLGPNGAGKTTTIRCLLSMLRPTSGKAYLFGEEVGIDGRELRRSIGYVAGDVALFDRQTGRWMIDYVSGLRGGPGPSTKELCERLQFDPSRKVKELSKGNKQKLALVIALMHDPDLLILDEPTYGLDPLNQQVVFDIVEERTREGATRFLSSHILSEVERVCERVAIIRAGTVVAEESVEVLLDKALRTAEITYCEPVPDSMFEGIPGVTSLERTGESSIRATIGGDIDVAIRRLMERPIKDIEIEHASLEEIFLEYYGHIEGEVGQVSGRPSVVISTWQFAGSWSVRSKILRLNTPRWRRSSSSTMGTLKGRWDLSLIHISEPTRLRRISYAVFCLKKKKNKKKTIITTIY